MRLGFSMEIRDAQFGHDLRRRPRFHRIQDLSGPAATQVNGDARRISARRSPARRSTVRCFARLIGVLTHGDVVIIRAVERLSRDTTDLLVIARDMQRAGAGIKSLAEPLLDTPSDFAEIIFAPIGIAATVVRRRILERAARGRADAQAKNRAEFSRKPSLTPHQQRDPRAQVAAGETQRSVARGYNVSQAAISRLP
jgi:DNA invertase Pin-like site-specific DNA recombinase